MATSGDHAIGASDGRRGIADPLKIEHPIAMLLSMLYGWPIEDPRQPAAGALSGHCGHALHAANSQKPESVKSSPC
jgi:hypothetical protein